MARRTCCRNRHTFLPPTASVPLSLRANGSSRVGIACAQILAQIDEEQLVTLGGLLVRGDHVLTSSVVREM
jgi:hypothetical protein